MNVTNSILSGNADKYNNFSTTIVGQSIEGQPKARKSIEKVKNIHQKVEESKEEPSGKINNQKSCGSPRYKPYMKSNSKTTTKKNINSVASKALSETSDEDFSVTSSDLLHQTKSKAKKESTKKLDDSPLTVATHSTTYKILSSAAFDEQFEEAFDLEMDDFKFYPAMANILISPVITSGVSTCLALVVKSFDVKGNFLYAGIGHFSSLPCTSFINETSENPLLKHFLDNAYNTMNNPRIPKAKRIEIFAFGMYEAKVFNSIHQKILKNYHIETDVQTLINPWSMPANYLERPDAEQTALDVFCHSMSISLEVGITRNGDICVMNASKGLPGANGFFQFNEAIFQICLQKGLLNLPAK